jgi:hypothetical protein
MGTDDPSQLELAEKKQNSAKPACRVFVLPLHIRDAKSPVSLISLCAL